MMALFGTWNVRPELIGGIQLGKDRSEHEIKDIRLLKHSQWSSGCTEGDDVET